MLRVHSARTISPVPDTRFAGVQKGLSRDDPIEL